MNKKTIGWILIILSGLLFGFLLWSAQLWFTSGVLRSSVLDKYILGFLRLDAVPLLVFLGFLASGLFFVTRKPKPPPN